MKEFLNPEIGFTLSFFFPEHAYYFQQKWLRHRTWSHTPQHHCKISIIKELLDKDVTLHLPLGTSLLPLPPFFNRCLSCLLHTHKWLTVNSYEVLTMLSTNNNKVLPYCSSWSTCRLIDDLQLCMDWANMLRAWLTKY